jgi:phosphatidate cytidylyltransferase
VNVPLTWFGWRHAFDHPVTAWITAGGVGILVAAPLLISIAIKTQRLNNDTRRELWSRYYSWLVLGPLMVGPILLGAFPTIIAICLLSLLCIREFARITGSFREKAVCLVVALGTLATFFAVLDHWYGLFVATIPLTVAAIAIVGVLPDEPCGYSQRVALGAMGYMLFGAGLGHFAYLANDVNYRPIMLMLIVCTQLNDVFAYCSGKMFGKRKLAPVTSPNKTWEGAIGAVVLTAVLVTIIANFVFEGTPLDRWSLLIVLGIMVSVLGQLGDLMLSAIKRDVGVKDTGSLIPGHGGLLDRFDSTMIMAPACFHYIAYYVGVGMNQDFRIMTGS